MRLGILLRSQRSASRRTLCEDQQSTKHVLVDLEEDGIVFQKMAASEGRDEDGYPADLPADVLMA